MTDFKQWEGFEGRIWKEEVNTRDFIQKNYTPYDGDESFLAGPTDATNKLWGALQKLQKAERAKGGVLDMETEVVSSLTAYGPGYIDESLKDLEQIVGLQTDKPLKRAFMPYGGIKMAEQACTTYGYQPSEELHKIFTDYTRTHNQAVFDAYTPEMKKARHTHIITGLPDTYGRGRIVGDYRRVALYGIDALIQFKQEDFANCGDGTMTDDVIRLREEIALQIRALNDSQQSKEEKLALIREELSKKDQLLRDTQVNYHQEKSKLEALTNLTERYEGYGGSVKKVMERKEQEKGIIGVVADIIKVDKKYETAIETALGGNIQNIVTDDEETAKRMIRFLKDTKSGRATFLPLTSITRPQEFKNPESLKEKGVIGMADELVHIDAKYKNVAKAMLGRIVVVDNVDNAVKIARKFDYGIRMVTLEGELLVPGGAISGGAFKNNSNLLGRRREIEELNEKVKKYLKQVDELLEDIEKTKQERNQLRLSLEEDKAALQKKFIEQNTARLNVIKAEERKNEASEGSMELKNEEREIETQIQEINRSKQEIQQELQDSEQLEKNVEQQIKGFTAELEEKRKEESEQSVHVSEWDVEVEKMLQQQNFHQQNVDRIDGEIERLSSELQEVLDSLKESTEAVELKRNSITEIEKTIEASHTTKSDTETKLKDDIAHKEELSAKQKNFFTDRESLAEKMTGLDKEVYRLNSQKERIQENIENQINYMWDEYEITLSDASSMRDETMTDLSAMKKETGSLKDQIKKLGDVNVNAIEDYKNLMERYTFLKTQHDDLVEAEKTLEGIIVELDTAMRKQFEEKFAEISREFDKVFKELFGGGKGTLELMEDEDILEAGIRIIAQPPGKKLQNMMQLSGGEKALTAIALLFAIQNLKPSPFCLLDEIEAALDENNVTRFAKYLHKLTKNTQFIVITHRRGTMEKADRLYGITMQEKGVSTLVSVNLIDKELSE